MYHVEWEDGVCCPSTGGLLGSLGDTRSSQCVNFWPDTAVYQHSCCGCLRVVFRVGNGYYSSSYSQDLVRKRRSWRFWRKDHRLCGQEKHWVPSQSCYFPAVCLCSGNHQCCLPNSLEHPFGGGTKQDGYGIMWLTLISEWVVSRSDTFRNISFLLPWWPTQMLQMCWSDNPDLREGWAVWEADSEKYITTWSFVMLSGPMLSWVREIK